MFTPIGTYIPSFGSLSNIAPFTYKDGETYLSSLESIRNFVNEVLIALVNENIEKLSENVVEAINDLILQVNTAIIEQNSDVDEKIIELTAYVDAAVTSIIDETITISDAVTHGIILNNASQTRILLDSLYNSEEATDALVAALAAEGGSLTRIQLDTLYTYAAEFGVLDTLDSLVTSGRLSTDVINGTYGNSVYVYGSGIDPTGVADSTAAIQAIITGNPGKEIIFPSGIFKITSLTVSKGQTLTGSGQQDWRDRFTVFGSAGWLVNANFNGTVIRSTLTTANPAITFLDSEVNSGGMNNITLIGPGSGTSIGILLGSTSITVVNFSLKNVKIGNFFEGVKMNYVNEGHFDSLAVHGCTTGVNLAYFTNQNVFTMLDIERCATGLNISSNSTANVFTGLICQSNTGTGLICAGIKNSFYGSYFENNTTRAIDVTGDGNMFSAPFLNGASDSIRVQAGADHNTFFGVGGYGTNITINDAGIGNVWQGRLSGLTVTGTQSIIMDAEFAGTAFGQVATSNPTVTGITLGNGTCTLKSRIVGKKFIAELDIIIGSTTVMNAIAAIAMPISPLGSTNGRPGVVNIFNTGDNWYFNKAGAYVNNAGSLKIGLVNASTGALEAFTSTTPIAWSAGDAIIVNIEFEVV